MTGADAAITVVIPLFNKERSIARALDSVRAQTSPATEVVVVDDGSTDGSAQVVAPYVERGEVVLIRQQNRGVSAARNAGVARAAAPFVAFLDGDDMWCPDHLARLRALIESAPNAFLYCTKSSKIDERGVERVFVGDADPRQPGVLADFYETYRTCEHVVNSSSACVPVHALQQVGGFPEGRVTGEDIYVWFRLAAAGTVAYSPVPTARVDLGGENRSTTRRSTTLPYHLDYYLAQGRIADVPAHLRDSAARALVRSAMLNCAGAVLGKNRRLALRYPAVVGARDWSATVKLALVALAPRAALTAARALRRSTAQTMEPGHAHR